MLVFGVGVPGWSLGSRWNWKMKEEWKMENGEWKVRKKKRCTEEHGFSEHCF